MSTTTIPASDWRAKLRSSKLGQLLVLLVTAAVLAGGWWAVNRGTGKSTVEGAAAVELTGDQSGEGAVVGKPAPDFTATALDGSKVTMSQLKGHPVWLNFGATWCTACRAEAPDIEAAWQKSKSKGVRIIDVYVGEEAPTVKKYVERLGLTYTHLVDPRTELGSLYQSIGLPTHVFIDREGIVRKVVVGGLPEEKMTQALSEIGG